MAQNFFLTIRRGENAFEVCQSNLQKNNIWIHEVFVFICDLIKLHTQFSQFPDEIRATDFIFNKFYKSDLHLKWRVARGWQDGINNCYNNFTSILPFWGFYKVITARCQRCHYLQLRASHNPMSNLNCHGLFRAASLHDSIDYVVLRLAKAVNTTKKFRLRRSKMYFREI